MSVNRWNVDAGIRNAGDSNVGMEGLLHCTATRSLLRSTKCELLRQVVRLLLTCAHHALKDDTTGKERFGINWEQSGLMGGDWASRPQPWWIHAKISALRQRQRHSARGR